MRILVCLCALGLLCSLFPAHPGSAATYYIRSDGGTASQCTGLADAPYPGSGEGRPCAWAHPFWALNPGSPPTWRIAGGDTVIIGPGEYRMGLGAPNSDWCDSEGAFQCHLPALPSGPDSAHPTRLVGAGWQDGCANKPQLWGAERPWQVLSLKGTSHAVVACLEITDHSSCVEFHADAGVACQRNQYPHGDWASAGLAAIDSSDVRLADLDIHGLASTGIQAGRLRDWTVERVRVAGNGWVGWEGDVSGDDSNSGTLRFSHLTVEWNGCGETWPGGEPHSCWGQSTGGYGDGLGTGRTAGHWIFEDCLFRFNTSDGLDLLYLREPGGRVDIRRTQSYANAGDQIKLNGESHIENSLMVSFCSYFVGKDFTYGLQSCRSGGSALVLTLLPGGSATVANCTLAGQGDCLGLVECDINQTCTGSERVVMVNNIFQGYQQYQADGSVDQTCLFWYGFEPAGVVSMDYNLVAGVKAVDESPLGAHDLQSDPRWVHPDLASFDGRLQAGSPGRDSGLGVGGMDGLVPDHDLAGASRPQGAGVDRGAFEE